MSSQGTVASRLRRLGYRIGRGAISASAALMLLAPAVGQCVAQSPPHPPLEQTLMVRRGRALPMITPADPEFDSDLELAFPGFETLPAYQRWRPFLVLLYNDTARYVRAYAVHWRLEYGNEPYGAPHSNLAEQGIAPDPARLTGVLTQAIPPQQYRLVSPQFSYGQSRWQAEFAADTSGKTFDAMYLETPPPAAYTRVVPDLDGVVWGDGSYSGPDASKIVEQFYAARDAWHDEALAVQRLMRCGAGQLAVAAALKRQRYRGLNDQGTHQRAWYIIGRRQAALRFEWIWQKGGYTGVERTVNWLVRRMAPHARMTPLGQWYEWRFLDHDLGPHPKRRGVPVPGKKAAGGRGI